MGAVLPAKSSRKLLPLQSMIFTKFGVVLASFNNIAICREQKTHKSQSQTNNLNPSLPSIFFSSRVQKKNSQVKFEGANFPIRSTVKEQIDENLHILLLKRRAVLAYIRFFGDPFFTGCFLQSSNISCDSSIVRYLFQICHLYIF